MILTCLVLGLLALEQAENREAGGSQRDEPGFAPDAGVGSRLVLSAQITAGAGTMRLFVNL
jgi:hypothetical protein